jgi:methionyl-tRNA formyltransferase
LKILFAGTPQFAVDHLAALVESRHEVVAVITQPDKPGKRGKKPVPSPVKQFALHQELDLLQPGRLRVAELSNLVFDLLVVVAYGQILRKDVLEKPTNGCINVHASLLPRWRGAAPIQRSILAGDTETGICIMQMDAGLDTGDLLLCEKVSISPTDNSATLSQSLADAGKVALLQVIDQIDQGTAIPIPQEEFGITYAKKIEKHEGRIDWSSSSTDIARLVNAFNPDPVAFAHLDTMRVRIWQASSLSGKSGQPPGEVLHLSRRGIEVACGSGILLISAIQLPVGKGAILNGSDLLNARRELVAPGTQFS